MGGKIPAHPLTAGEGNPMMEIEKEVGASSISPLSIFGMVSI
jgi:hypothetical protein